MIKPLSMVGIIALLFFSGISATVSAQGPSQAIANVAYLSPIVQDFRWVGVDADMVGDSGAPDGIKDAHFQLVLNLPEPMAVSRITLYRSDETGTRAIQPYIWDSDPSTSWGFLGVFYNGALIYDQPTLSKFSGEVTLDLYCKDNGEFAKGNYFGVQPYLIATHVTMI